VPLIELPMTALVVPSRKNDLVMDRLAQRADKAIALVDGGGGPDVF